METAARLQKDLEQISNAKGNTSVTRLTVASKPAPGTSGIKARGKTPFDRIRYLFRSRAQRARSHEQLQTKVVGWLVPLRNKANNEKSPGVAALDEKLQAIENTLDPGQKGDHSIGALKTLVDEFFSIAEKSSPQAAPETATDPTGHPEARHKKNSAPRARSVARTAAKLPPPRNRTARPAAQSASIEAQGSAFYDAITNFLDSIPHEEPPSPTIAPRRRKVFWEPPSSTPPGGATDRKATTSLASANSRPPAQVVPLSPQAPEGASQPAYEPLPPELEDLIAELNSPGVMQAETPSLPSAQDGAAPASSSTRIGTPVQPGAPAAPTPAIDASMVDKALASLDQAIQGLAPRVPTPTPPPPMESSTPIASSSPAQTTARRLIARRANFVSFANSEHSERSRPKEASAKIKNG